MNDQVKFIFFSRKNVLLFTDEQFQRTVFRKIKLTDIKKFTCYPWRDMEQTSTGETKISNAPWLEITDFYKYKTFHRLVMLSPDIYRFESCNAKLFSGINILVHDLLTHIYAASRKKVFDYFAKILKVDPSVVATIENLPAKIWLVLEYDKKGNCIIYKKPEYIDDGEPPF